MLDERGKIRNIDWWLVLCYMALVFIGWINIYASIHSSEPSSIFDPSCRSGKQFIWMMAAFAMAILIMFVFSPRIYEGFSAPIYFFTLALLVSVIFLGTEVKGSRSWFEFGPVRFQPAEISKIATSVFLAKIMSHFDYNIRKAKDFIITALIIAVPMMIIVAQSETGSALVYVGFVFVLYREGLSGWLIFMIGMAIMLFILTLTASPYTAIIVLCWIVTLCDALYVSSIKYWLKAYFPGLIVMSALPFGLEYAASEFGFLSDVDPMVILLIGVAAALPFAAYFAYRHRSRFTFISMISVIAGIIFVFSSDLIFNNVLQEHQQKRIEVLLGMKDDPAGAGYNVKQSMIAIGSGGLTGKGYLKGTQTTYGFVPEQSTDFIFCTIGEEWGFLGSTAVILLYVFLIWRLVSRAEQAKETFTRIYGYCAACCIFMHLFINIGMTVGIMPVIGIPLPFVSYGGSSLLAFTVLLFIFIALDCNERRH